MAWVFFFFFVNYLLKYNMRKNYKTKNVRLHDFSRVNYFLKDSEKRIVFPFCIREGHKHLNT